MIRKMDKISFRKNIQAELVTMNRVKYEQQSYIISKKLTNSAEWKNAKTIALTVSRFPEVDTWQLIRKGWEEGKKIVVPKCYPEKKEMLFYQISAFDELETVYHDLYEPIEGKTKRIENDEIDLLIVPGLAFNCTGYRIGFGGGYYDRFLMNYNGLAVSVAFSEQIVNQLPTENHDLPVQKIYTDQNIICPR